VVRSNSDLTLSLSRDGGKWMIDGLKIYFGRALLRSRENCTANSMAETWHA
jgi:hypothetical protein